MVFRDILMLVIAKDAFIYPHFAPLLDSKRQRKWGEIKVIYYMVLS